MKDKEKLKTVIILDGICAVIWTSLVIMELLTYYYINNGLLFVLYCINAVIWTLAMVKQIRYYKKLEREGSFDTNRQDDSFDINGSEDSK